jgi:hypothetical protein
MGQFGGSVGCAHAEGSRRARSAAVEAAVEAAVIATNCTKEKWRDFGAEPIA